jgi:hypothetical protein
MKNLLLIILLFPAFCQVYSQASASEDYQNTLRQGLMGFEYKNTVERNKGNQYFSDWAKGIVYCENGDVITDIFLRYDKYMDEVLWLRETDFKAGILPRSDVRAFVVYNDRKEPLGEFMRRKIKLPYKADSSEAFLQVLVKGDLELFAFRKVIQIANDYTSLRDDTRYIIFSGSNSCFVGASKRLLLKVPGIDEMKLKAVLKSGRIKLDGTENSLVRVIELYNQSK